jgi:epoxyqueuosine reductase
LDLDIINEKNKIQKSNCGTCSQCIDICPTKAFVAPYKLDANKCISYLTIEHKTHIPREFRALIGNRIYGCDDCLAVCPWNKYAKISNNMSFIPREDLKKPSLESLSLLSDEDFRKYFSGSPIKRIGRNQFIRNVLIAMGNSSNKSLVKNIINLLGDNSSIVRLSAVWALGQLCKNSFFLEMNKRVKEEKEQEVINEWLETEKEINHCGTYG